MNPFSSISLDLTIVLVFLAINLAVGLYWGRGVKNIKDFALGGRNFTTFALVATLVATWCGGGTFSVTLSNTYSDGIGYVVALCSMSIGFFLTAYIFVPRMGRFLGDISVADTMGKIYGDKVRVITAIAGTIGASGFIALQFKVIGNILNFLITPNLEHELSSTSSILLAAGIVTFYSAFGGVKSVTFTDVLQFLTFGIVLPIIAFIIWSNFNSSGYSIKSAFAHPQFDIKEAFSYKNPAFWPLITITAYLALPGVEEPPMYQRIILGRNIFQVKRAWIFAGIILIFMILVLASMSFFIFHIKPGLNKSEILPYIIENYSFPGFKVLIFIAIIALAMSTADSNINTSAVMFANDVFFKSKSKLKLARIFSIFLGIGGIYFALYGEDLLSIVLNAKSFYVPIITIPLYITILGFRTETKAILTGMVAGGVTVIIWKNILKIDADPIVVAMGVNFIFIMASHYLLKLKGGWNAVETPNEVLMIRDNRKRKWKKIKEYITGFSYPKLCAKYSLKNEMNYITFGIVSFFITMVTLYSMPGKMQILQFEGLKILLVVALTTSAVFSGFYLWPKKLKRLEYIERIFPFGALILLPCMGSLFVIASGFYTTQLMIFILDMVILSLLMRWKLAIIIATSGIYLANKLAPYMFEIDATQNYINHIDVIYPVLLLSVFVIRFFVGPKEESDVINEFIIKAQEKRHDEEMREIVKLKDHRGEYIRRMESKAIMIFRNSYKDLQLLESYDTVKTKTQLDDFLKKFSPIVSNFNDGVDYFSNIFKSIETEIEINLADANIKDVIHEAIEEHKKHSGKDNANFINIIRSETYYKEITIDKELLKTAIKDLLSFITKISEEKPIEVILESDIIRYDMNFTKVQMKQEAIKLSFIFKRDEEILGDRLIEDSHLSDIFNVIDAHYGEVQENLQGNKSIYSFFIPKDIYAVRPRALDIRNLIIKKLNRVTEEIVKEKATIDKQELAKKLQENGMKKEKIAELLALDMEKI